MTEPLIKQERKKFHAELLLKSVLILDTKDIPSNADKDNRSSVQFATGIANRLSSETGKRLEKRLAGQSSGHKFEAIVAEFLQNTFPYFKHLRPGTWDILQVTNRKWLKIAEHSQYEHLITLSKISKHNPELLSSLGNDYLIAPDIIVSRQREKDSLINGSTYLVDDSFARLTDLRSENGSSPILHASISTKWTIRSDRVQNARSEALNLIRNRKGRLPNIVVVTGEPTPSRLSSIALGTGDVDCVYHFALTELKEAIEESGNDEALQLLSIMIDGKRLKDIADLPFDLAI